MSPVHRASLVDPSLHSLAMLELLELKVDRPLIEHVIQCTIDTIDYALADALASRGRQPKQNSSHQFAHFASNVIQRSEVTVSTLLVVLVYLHRAKYHICIESADWAHERIFLGSLIVASKFTNDSTLKNVHWSLVTKIFGRRDIGRIEREFLSVLDWELSISEADILAHHDSVIALYKPSHVTFAPFHIIPSSPTHSRSRSSASSSSSSSTSSSFSSSIPSSLDSPGITSSEPDFEVIEIDADISIPPLSNPGFSIPEIAKYIPRPWSKSQISESHSLPSVAAIS